MKLNCMVVDDEHFARKLLREYIRKVPHLELIGTYKNALLATEGLQNHSIDLLFLDIQMPELKGTDFLKTLPQKPLTIFTTAYSEYALEGFELDVVDYLLKPIKFERFLQAVNKAQQRFKPAALPTPSSTNYLILKSSHKTHKVHYQDITHIEGLKEYVIYHTTNGKIIVLQSLKKLEETLPQDQFIRIHRSYIVNIAYAKSLAGNELAVNELVLPVGKTYLEEVKRRIFL